MLLETFLANSCFCVSAPALYLAIIFSFAFICFSKFSIIVLFAVFASSVAPNACCTAFKVWLFAVRASIVPWLVADKFSSAVFNPVFDVCNDSTIVFTPVTSPGVVFPFACVSFNPFNTCVLPAYNASMLSGILVNCELNSPIPAFNCSAPFLSDVLPWLIVVIPVSICE